MIKQKEAGNEREQPERDSGVSKELYRKRSRNGKKQGVEQSTRKD